MPTFIYECLRGPDDPVQGEIEAESAQAAMTALAGRKLAVLSVTEKTSPENTGFWGRRIGRAELLHHLRDLAQLQESGLALSQSLDILAATKHPPLRHVFQRIRAQLQDGSTLAEAMASQQGVFNPLQVCLVRVGEESGRLPQTLGRIVETGEKSLELRNRVVMAMVYPAVMLSVAAFTVFAMMTFVIPMFTDVFRQTGQQLPLPTQILVALSAFLRAWWLPLALALAASGLFVAQWHKTPQGRRFLGALSLGLPVVGPIFHMSQQSIFCRTMGTLLESGIPMVQALRTAAGALGNLHYREAVQAAEHQVRDGNPLSQTLGESRLFDEKLVRVAAVGERTGGLPEAFTRLANQLDDAVSRRLRVAVTLAEPILIIVIGLIVGFIVLAMLLPIFTLGEIVEM